VTPDQLAVAVAHFTEDFGLVFAVGAIVVRRLGRIAPRITWVEPPLGGALAIATLGGVVVLLVGQTGWLTVPRIAAEALAWLLCVRGSPYVAPVAVLAATLLPLTGHAAHVFPAAGAEFADALHVLSAGIWAGGVIALLTLRPPGGWSSPEARQLLDRFARIAGIALGITVLTGLLGATEHLVALSDLWTTAYGIVLALKGVGVVAMAGLSVLWRRGARVEKVDEVVAVGVVLATGLLAALPPPA
jgi:putative copper export protein